MANGNFLQDISEGIFERLGELRKEQEAKDEAQKLNVIKLYSSMADKIEPEGLPTLMTELGKTIGVKGKLKGFWDAFSGMPDRSIEDQLGTQMRNLPGLMVGAGAARTTREHGDIARLFQGGTQTPEQKATGEKMLQEEKALGGKMIFRDPRQEKLDEIKARAEVAEQLAAERAQTQAYYQSLRQEDAQKHAKEITELRESQRTARPLETEAKQIAILNGRPEGKPTIDDYEWAARTLQVRGQLNDEALRQLGYYRQEAIREKQANLAGGSGSTNAAQRLAIARRGETNKIQSEHQANLAEYAAAKGKEEATIKEINDTLAGTGSKYIPGQGIVGGDLQGATIFVQAQLDRLKSQTADRETAAKKAQGSFGRAGNKAYRQYLKRGASALDPIEVLTPPTPPSRGNVSRVGLGPRGRVSQRVTPDVEPALGPFDKIMRGVNPLAFKDGQILPMADGTGRKWKVTGKGKNSIRLSPVFQE